MLGHSAIGGSGLGGALDPPVEQRGGYDSKKRDHERERFQARLREQRRRYEEKLAREEAERQRIAAESEAEKQARAAELGEMLVTLRQFEAARVLAADEEAAAVLLLVA